MIKPKISLFTGPTSTVEPTRLLRAIERCQQQPEDFRARQVLSALEGNPTYTGPVRKGLETFAWSRD